MKPKEFEVIVPISKTREFAGNLKIEGAWRKEEGNLLVDIDTVSHSYDTMQWVILPTAIWDSFNDIETFINDASYSHCLICSEWSMDDIDTTTDNNQEHYLQTNNKLS